jgi:2'-5' RNA ligase
MRLFVALDLPAGITTALQKIEPKAGRGVRRVRAGHMHVTLHFIGDVDVETVRQSLESVQCERCNLTVRDVGRFRINGGRTILWVGVSETPELLNLHATCGRALTTIGIPIERRRFVPHVTLARLGPAADKSTIESFLRAGKGSEFGAYTAERFVLYDSVTKESGTSYEAIASFPLR